MAKYLYKTSFSQEGVSGLLKEGGTSRIKIVEKALASMGGKLEAYYFAFGGTDAYVIVDLPDNATAASGALTVGASGTGTVETVVLITPEEIDAAAQKTPDYRPPGQ